MNLTQIPNLRVEDFPSEQSWIGKLFSQLNPFLQSLNQVLDSNIDFTTNIRAVTKDYSITQFQSFKLAWPFKSNPPVEVRVAKASQGASLLPTVLFPAWSYNAGDATITIHQIYEMSKNGFAAASGQYTFTLRATV